MKVNFDRLHDILVELDGKSRGEQELSEIFNSLPEQIKNIAYQWSGSDTVFGDEAYSYLLKKMEHNHAE